MVIVIVSPEEIPQIAAPLLALFEAQSQASLDAATAAILARRAPEPEPSPAPNEGVET